MPSLADPSALQDDMIDIAGRQAATHDKSGLAAANDDDVGFPHHNVIFKSGDVLERRL